MHVDDILYVLWSEAHAETGQVSVAEGEEDHENDVPGVVSEHHGQVVSGLNVTEHEERNEHQACDDQDGQPDAVFTGLNREQRARQTSTLMCPQTFIIIFRANQIREIDYILFMKTPFSSCKYCIRDSLIYSFYIEV